MLLELLELTGCLVTIDAVGCQREIAGQIIDQGGEYVLGLKGNQSALHEGEFAGVEYNFYEEMDKDHGRLETRHYWITEELRTYPRYGAVARATQHRPGRAQLLDRRDRNRGATFFVNAILADARRFPHAVRGHWGVENRLHWRLEVVFRENASCIHKGNAPAIMTAIGHLCMNLFEHEPSPLPLAQKRRQAAWDDDYRAKIVFG